MRRVDFRHNLQTLQDELVGLGHLVERAITRALDGLKNRDLALSRKVVEEDDIIDRKRYQLEEQVIDLIATQQPLAVDLRTLLAVLHISVELERMGDYAEGIAKISLMMGDEPPIKPLIDIPLMAEKAIDMLSRSLKAFTERDAKSCYQICVDDDEVDVLYDQVYRDLLVLMLQDPKVIQRATYLLWVSHDLERIADRATNIAERVIFLVTGKLTELNVSKY